MTSTSSTITVDTAEKIDSSKGARSTESAKLSHKKKLNEFLLHVKITDATGLRDEGKLKECVGGLKFFEQYAYWLVYVALKDDGDEYASGTVLQFISYLHNDVALNVYSAENCDSDGDRRTRDWLLNIGDNTWYSKLRHKVNSLCFDRAVARGEEVGEQCASAGKVAVAAMATFLMDQNTRDCLIRRYAIVSSFTHAGRTG